MPDLSPDSQAALRGPAGPAGPAGVALRASVNASGAQVAGNATVYRARRPGKAHGHVWPQPHRLHTHRDARPQSGGRDPGAGSIVSAIEGGKVAVETYDAAGTKTNLPFNLLVAC